MLASARRPLALRIRVRHSWAERLLEAPLPSFYRTDQITRCQARAHFPAAAR